MSTQPTQPTQPTMNELVDAFFANMGITPVYNGPRFNQVPIVDEGKKFRDTANNTGNYIPNISINRDSAPRFGVLHVKA